jgi:hypothetical protein
MVKCMKCYEIKECLFNGTSPNESKCPPYKLQIGCWEYDWASFYNSMPECKEKLEWLEEMLKNCPACVVYRLHREEMKGSLDKLHNL